ncbi:Immunity protein 19 [Clostridium cavendishii DSM 21758]|uniref:Immunity protein 19 n=1 Tax=Clostridium cavendishii DSM 21758 TaxID=1121302 RepID=A0A1M6J9E6_9CLOT|nr:Imm19 family immunity protein [Clostridium cavendishii]SHJ43315.1 Immunity protein 19 [Clostridium cavendishii DSM 21758]
MNNILTLDDLFNECETFWPFFFSKCYPNGYFEKEDIELAEYIRGKYCLPIEWVDDFTKYYAGVFDEEDGYVKNPRKVIVDFANNNLLEIEFHPGDTIFYLNKENIGCTGPHFELHKISWNELKKLLLNVEYKEFKLFMILPMVFIQDNEIDEVFKVITECLTKLPFKSEDYTIISKCIVENIIGE